MLAMGIHSSVCDPRGPKICRPGSVLFPWVLDVGHSRILLKEWRAKLCQHCGENPSRNMCKVVWPVDDIWGQVVDIWVYQKARIRVPEHWNFEPPQNDSTPVIQARVLFGTDILGVLADLDLYLPSMYVIQSLKRLRMLTWPISPSQSWNFCQLGLGRRISPSSTRATRAPRNPHNSLYEEASSHDCGSCGGLAGPAALRSQESSTQLRAWRIFLSSESCHMQGNVHSSSGASIYPHYCWFISYSTY